MSLGAGIMERCSAVREVPRRLPFFQTVRADIHVGHSDTSEVGLGRVHASRHLIPHSCLAASQAAGRPQSWANAFASSSEIRELGRQGENNLKIIHAPMQELPD
eukprot:2462659-Rhodomonas_salina.1